MDDEYQGCGISRLWATSENDPLKSACLLHDKFYTKGSGAQEILTRKEADKIFLAHMMKLSKGKISLLVRAHIYYIIVRLFGAKYWEGNK